MRSARFCFKILIMAEASTNDGEETAHHNGINGRNGVNGTEKSPTASVEKFLEMSYDFIVVGGGTAGLTIAARLTEDPNITVGVIEAGKNRLGDMLVDTPAMFLQMLGNPEYDWMMFTTPQVWHVLVLSKHEITQLQEGNKGKVHHFPRGKLLGGSSGINYMM